MGSPVRSLSLVLACLLLSLILGGASECNRPPPQTCASLCQESQPEDCAEPSELVMGTEANEEEPLAVGGSWMCGCPAKNGHLILHLAHRKACRTPRGWTAHDIHKRAPSDD